ncbi:hypothetical protein J6590_094577 [Homalodisca vitripennis]|nr:hypothetical protein J6590_094577 [Homalodisca vitripennis]
MPYRIRRCISTVQCDDPESDILDRTTTGSPNSCPSNDKMLHKLHHKAHAVFRVHNVYIIVRGNF